MSIYSRLEEAISEVTDHLCQFEKVGAFIVRTKDREPYCPIYVMPAISAARNTVEELIKFTEEKIKDREIVAVFAIIR